MKHRLARWLLVVLVLLAPATLLAQTEGWSTPYRFVSPTRSNWFPSLTVDPWGRVHLFWSSGKGKNEAAWDFLMYSKRLNGAWTTSNDIIHSGFGGWVSRSSVAVDRSGRLHLLVRNIDSVYYTTAASDEAASAHGWSALRKINGIGMPYYPAIAIDSTGGIHIVWSELTAGRDDQECLGCSDIWYRRSQDGGATWTAPVNLSNSAVGSIKPQLIVDNKRLVVSWDEGKDPNAITGGPVGIAYAISTDLGTSWQPARRFSEADDMPQQAAFAVDGTNTALLVFRATTKNALLYRTSNDDGRTWSDPQPLGDLYARDWNDTPWDKYSVATDSAGNVHLLAAARQNPEAVGAALFHVTWLASEQAWTKPDIIFSDDDDFPEWPQFVISEGNRIHATWFTRNKRDQFNEDSAYQVWYSERLLDAPAQPVEIIATATPQPTPQPTMVPVQPTEQAVPLDPLVLVAPQPQSVQNEAPILRSLGYAIAPSCVAFFVVLVLVLRRR